ncbi:hypothetical protein DPSP01_012343 [Paraphaeosphaeria sporulosa]|uniref:F-box domain-containing protein n=1 Tax=Paraphaeosphaeria sporulosa TaxID=1460663 RepID=A0A177BZZ2_9PLEO|nr:uncharacterized protein CC84DRAFT_1168157 [Paraphaeosphaeria sporulosa]OAG00953.1 hypothetical protein CC84DRAFT_1168157 [Paraphaeosphaeria sporulosa]
MPSLLSLPLEIRDNIIDYVITSQRDPPTARNDHSSRRDTRIQFEDTHWKEIGNLIYFESSPTAFRPAFGGLLLACQQLRADTLKRVSKADVPMILDVLAVNEETIWVTWLSLPLITGRMIEKLDIQYRYQYDGQEQSEETTNTHKWTLDFTTQLRYLIYRILAVGSAGPLPDSNRRRLWTGARYKFNDTIRFEHEYIPHYSIRMLRFHAPRPFVPPDAATNLLHSGYRTEVNDMIEEVALRNVIYQGRKHPGWKLARERIGGILSFFYSGMLDLGTYSDLNDLYLSYSSDPSCAQIIAEILEGRKANDL